MTEETKKELLLDEVDSALSELHIFEEKGNKSAGRRSRKHLSTISKLCKEIRADIQAGIKSAESE